LKSLKTAKGIFGKAWRFQGKNLEILGVDLEKLADASAVRRATELYNGPDMGIVPARA
jgi:hypothetical protein